MGTYYGRQTGISLLQSNRRPIRGAKGPQVSRMRSHGKAFLGKIAPLGLKPRGLIKSTYMENAFALAVVRFRRSMLTRIWRKIRAAFLPGEESNLFISPLVTV